MTAVNDKKALLYGLLAVLLWSTVATAFKLALREIDVLQLLFYAVVSSSVVLLAIVGWLRKTHLLGQYLKQRPLYFLCAGVVNPLIYYLILLRAYDLLPAQQAQSINYTWAIAMALLAVPLLGQKLSGRDVLAAVLGYAGVLIIATGGRVLDMEFDSLEGVAYALASTLVWALYWISTTRQTGEPVVCLCLNFLMAVPFIFCLCATFSTVELENWGALPAAVYVGVFEMGATFALWATALKMASGVARIGNLIFLSPVISLVFISRILDEEIHWATLIGLALIIPAVLLQQMQTRAQRVSD